MREPKLGEWVTRFEGIFYIQRCINRERLTLAKNGFYTYKDLSTERELFEEINVLFPHYDSEAEQNVMNFMNLWWRSEKKLKISKS